MVLIKMQPKVIRNSNLNKSEKKNSKLNKLLDYLNKVRDENFTGYIKVNFSQGSIGRIERFEEILKK